MKNYINFRNHYLNYESNRLMSLLAMKNLDDNNPDNDYLFSVLKEQARMPQIKADVLFKSGADFSIISKGNIDLDKKTYFNKDDKICFNSSDMNWEIFINRHFFIENKLKIDDEDINSPFSITTNRSDNSLFDILKGINNKIRSNKGKDFDYFYDYFYNNNLDNEKALDFINSSLCQQNPNITMNYILREDKSLPAYLDFITQNWDKYYEQESDMGLLDSIFVNNCFYIYSSLKDTEFLKNKIEQEAELLINNVNISPDYFFNKSFINKIEKDLLVENIEYNKSKNKRNKPL